MSGVTRYVSPDEDSARWASFPFRPGDIVISTRSKSGTTWVQMICALLVFRGPDLPAPLAELSPWLDWLVEPRERAVERLRSQRHRRIIKTHTPLDGLPLDDRATFVVVGRHPLDTAVSLYHQGDNLDRRRMRELMPSAEADAADDGSDDRSTVRPPLADWLREWIAWVGSPVERLDSLPGVLHHAADAWRRRDRTNVVLLRYGDLERDLAGQIAGLAARLAVRLEPGEAADLARHATFPAMRARSREVVPDRLGVLRDPARFFRRGRSGAGEELLTPDELSAYRARVRRMAPSDVVDWLHHW